MDVSAITLVSVWFVFSGIGLSMCYLALFRDREHGLPRCPRCWYLMIGATGRRCPECGHVVNDNRDFFRRRRRWRAASIWIALTLLPGAFVAYRFRNSILRICLPKWRLIEDVSTGPYSIRLYEERFDVWPKQVRVFLKGEPVYTFTAWSIEIGGHPPDANQSAIVNQALIGDRVPNLVFYEYSGGAHCCWTAHIFSLDDGGLRPIATIEGLDSDVVFEDVDQDGVYEARLYDMTYRYWPGSFADSPAPEVILTYRAGRYVISDLMRTPLPDATVLAAQAEQIRQDATWSGGSVPPRAYLQTAFDLIYAGHERAAWEFAEAAWPADLSGYRDFAEEMHGMLERSPYWPEIRVLNRRGE